MANIDNKLYEKSIKILKDLIAFKTISGENNSSLINYCEDILKKNGASSFKVFDENKKRVNLFATLKAKKPNGVEQLFYLDIRMWCLFQKAGRLILLKQK